MSLRELKKELELIRKEYVSKQEGVGIEIMDEYMAGELSYDDVMDLLDEHYTGILSRDIVKVLIDSLTEEEDDED